MSDQNKHSDEYISAYIDGELDSEERAHLLYDEQEDIVLAQRINDARILKEKIQLAYPDMLTTNDSRKPFSCSAFIKQQKSLVAGLIIIITSALILLPVIVKNDDVILARQLIKNTPAVSPDTISKAIGQHKHVLINLSQYQPQTFDATLDSIEKVLQLHESDKSFNIEIIAFENGLKAFDTNTSAHLDRINQITQRFTNFEVIACAKSLATLLVEGVPIQLSKAMVFTPSAAQQVAKRTSEGWLYLRI